MRVLSLISRKISRLLIGTLVSVDTGSDWWSFRHFPGYQIRIKLICRLTKIRDQALILEFPAVINEV